MRGALNILAGLLLCAVFLAASASSFAQEGHTQSDIKLLIDSASVLQQYRPDLAAGLYSLADRQAKELQAKTYEEKAKEDKAIKDMAVEKQEPAREPVAPKPERVPQPTGIITGY
jgi:hypothetical protein